MAGPDRNFPYDRPLKQLPRNTSWNTSWNVVIAIDGASVRIGRCVFACSGFRSFYPVAAEGFPASVGCLPVDPSIADDAAVALHGI